MYDVIKQKLQGAYDAMVDERDSKKQTDWKLKLRTETFAAFQDHGSGKLLEIGAGTGSDSFYFQALGVAVCSTDLSYQNLRRCWEKGLMTVQMDFQSPAIRGGYFDALYAMNCLLHVPHGEFPVILAGLCRLIRPGGLFFLGQYGGRDREGYWDDDHYQPKRFYAFWTDTQIVAQVEDLFSIERFQRLEVLGDSNGLHFQALLLKKI